MSPDPPFDPEYEFDSASLSFPKPPPPLPEISADSPVVHPGCCLALSTPLLSYLREALLPPNPTTLVLSVGSGYGLLEALLLEPPSPLNLIGVEVAPSPNTYLPAEQHSIVPGSRFLEPLAAEAGTWLFVYPRRVGLIEEYLRAYGQGAVRKVVWIGPVADWEDYEGCFGGWNVDVARADTVGGRSWETIAFATRG